MRIKTIFTAVMLTLVGVGFIGSVWATPSGSQRLRGLADRIFVIEGEYLFSDPAQGIPPVGTKFDNCYYFNDGNWVDPLFLEGFIFPGSWLQHSNGANTSYTAMASAFGGFVTLIQDGTVTPYTQ